MACSSLLFKTSIAALAVAGFSLTTVNAYAEDGVTKTSIRFGQSAALSGPSKNLGRSMRAGILAAFEEVNQAGGIKGRKLVLETVDDGYEPVRAASNTKAFAAAGNIFAFIGNVGTPTSRAAQPIATEKGIPFVAPYTGAKFLRDPQLTNVVNIRASYDQEAEAWIQYAVDDKGFSRVAIFYQDDSYGKAGLRATEKALGLRNLKLVGKGAYHRNQIDVDNAVALIAKSKPDVIAMVGSYEACAEFIKKVKAMGIRPLFLNLSFVGSQSLSDSLGKDRKGVIISEVVPEPGGSSPIAIDYRRAMGIAFPNEDHTHVSLEGYIAGRFVSDVLRRMRGSITRQSFLSTIRNNRSFVLGELKLVFGPLDNQGLDDVHLSVLEVDGSLRPITKTRSVPQSN